MRTKRDELILKMTHKELVLNLLVSQLLFMVAGFILSFLLFDTLSSWTDIISWSSSDILFYGVLPGFSVVFIDLILMRVLPEGAYDDGGLNKKLFSEARTFEVFLIALVVSVCEEILFRGVLQSVFGIYIASIVFALVHFRYLKKPILFLSVVFLSFLLGFSYKLTGNLLVTIAMHFTIDFVLGLIIQRKERGNGRQTGKQGSS